MPTNSVRRNWKTKLATVAGLLLVAAAVIAAGPRAAKWKEVEEDMKKGLPKSAIEKLEPIIAEALKEKAYAEAVKAIAQKIALEGNIQGNKPEEKITRMNAEIAKAPAEMKPVLQAIMANWFWHYYQQNNWRFMQRTATAAPPGDDFTTWDLPRLFAEIDKHFQAALSAADVLKKIPIAQYDELLQKGNAPDAYRPTLYDFLAFNALEFYQSGEQGAARPQDAFFIQADGPIFGTVEEFIAWKPETTDESAAVLKAIAIYQSLLRFHQADDDRAALLDADLSRLAFGNNSAVGEEKTARFKAAMKRFAERHADHEISTRALHQLALAVWVEGNAVDARTIAQQGLARFPDSVGGRSCFNLIQQIEARELNVTTERVWNQPLPTIDVTYRNVTKIHFRAVTFDFEAWTKRQRYQPEQLDDNERKALLAQKPVLAWSSDLPATEDFQSRVENLPAPKTLKPGSYFLIASHNETFNEANNQISFAEFSVSDLALVIRSHQGDGVVDGFVLNAISGEPLDGATVRGWAYDNNGNWTPVAPTKTDANGLFRFSAAQNAMVLHAAHGGHALSSANPFHAGRYDTTVRPYEQTIFFTDRALYRPGQTIHYKGICAAVDTNGNSYKTIADRGLTVVFNDVNGKEIERRPHKTNDFGSFSGSVTAPRDRLMGRMTLYVDGQPPGQTQVTVEEYKRPKFQVKLDAPKEAAKLNGPVKLTGHATAYTGAAIDGAKVTYRVVREVRYPGWWYWRCWWMPVQNNSQEIAHGSAVTGTDGSFGVEFTAKADPTVAEESEPTFQFTIHADVTDTTGETRSDSRSVNVGFTALSATLSADDWQVDDKPVEISVRTTTLDGEPLTAEGTLKVYSVRQPKKVERAALGGGFRHFPMRRDAAGKMIAPAPDPANVNSWPLGEVVFEAKDKTDATGLVKAFIKLPVGMYRAKYETQDKFGKTVTAELPIRVLDPDAGKLALRIPNLFESPKWSVEPGEEFLGLWGSGYDSARAFVEIEHRRKVLKAFWTEAGATQFAIKQPIDEALRGGFTVRVTMVRENRAYLNARKVEVPWSNKNLALKWEHFTSKLEPAQKETWTLTIQRPESSRHSPSAVTAKPAAAIKAPADGTGTVPATSTAAEPSLQELVAALYDASLDAYQPHAWQGGFGVFYQDYSPVHAQFENQMKYFQYLVSTWQVQHRDDSLTYRSFPHEIIGNFWGFEFGMMGGQGRNRMYFAAPGAPMEAAAMAMDGLAAGGAPMAKMAARGERQLANANFDAAGLGALGDKGPGGAASPDLSKVSARKNLNETAFFLPHLISEKDGTVKFEFTMPEALTEWKFQGFAHDTSLRGGLLTDKVVTAKDLMVQPNPPRFLREGDALEFTVKVSNQSATRQTGTVRLSLADARTAESADAALGNTTLDQAFDIPSKESRTFSWRLAVPDEIGFLTYKAIGSTGRLSDGEEGFLPVLSRRILVTESLPLPIRGAQTKNFNFEKLSASGGSDSLKHKSLTVQMVSNPSWYAVMALPYLMEYPHECSEQVFNRMYANMLAQHIAASDPKIRRVFDTWKAAGGDTLDSPLEKNQDLKSVMLEETPWYRQAKRESQARRDVGILFDENRLNSEVGRTFSKLAEMQGEDGRWPWFPGGPPNEYITLYITTGFGRLRHLGVKLDVAPAVRSLQRLDAWADEIYRHIPADKRDQNHLSTTIALYLYGRSFFLEDQAVAPNHKEAVDYWLGQAKKHWLALAHRQSQAHLAIALKRFGDVPAAKGIMASIKERSVSDEELGMFWRDLELSWWWYRAPIETQAMMIEAFDEVMNDAEAVEDCKVWLLKQKQTQDWKTTKATADAVYALLLRGENVLASDALVEVALGGQAIKPENIETGTGFYEHRFVGPEIKPNLGQITVKKTDAGVAWGSVHWQYMEDMAKITPHEATPLKLEKKLFIKQNSPKGPVLVPVAGPVAVGDELVVRVVLRTDRDMEYVHLKDHRGSGTEPVNVLSQYKFQDGLYYYESTRDTASHFFIDYLPKGVYVFEYSVRVQHRGAYQTGMANIECMYAPEFNSHSESIKLEVK